MTQINRTIGNNAGKTPPGPYVRNTDKFTNRNIPPPQSLSVPVMKPTVPLEKVLNTGLFVP